MSLFKRNKKRQSETKVNISSKFIDALNYVPMDYTHSPGFAKTSEEALAEAREEVKLLKVIDPYIDDFRDPFIDSRVQYEVDFGKRQYTNHVGTILHIGDEATNAKIKAENIMKEVESKLEVLEEKQAYYTALLQESRKGGN